MMQIYKKTDFIAYYFYFCGFTLTIDKEQKYININKKSSDEFKGSSLLIIILDDYF